ncbi:hypothetical protein BT095_10170, partial [Corynebacterium diphtheriae]
LTLSLTEFTAWMHRETPHNLVSDFSVRIMGSSSGLVWIFIFLPLFAPLHQCTLAAVGGRGK